MQVIRHDDVTTYSDVVHRMRVGCEFQQCGVHRICCQKFPAPVGTECDEEERIVAEDAAESGRKLWIIGHRNDLRCSRAPPLCSRRPAGDARASHSEAATGEQV